MLKLSFIRSWVLTRFSKRTLALLILLISLAIRLVYASLAEQVDPILRRAPLYGDGSGYHLLALNLLKGWGLTWDGLVPTSIRMPGYPVFIALVYYLTEPDPIYVRLAQALIGSLTCIPVMAVARKLGGNLAAVLAGIGVAFHPLIIYLTGWIYSETVFLPLVWIGVWLLVESLSDGKRLRAVLGGLCIGLAAYMRPEIIFFPAATVVGTWVLLRWPKERIVQLLIAGVTAAALVLPWTIRNAVVHQTFVPLTTNTGGLLFGGNNPAATGGWHFDVPFILPGYTEVASDQEYTRRAVEWVRENPADFLALLPRKLVRFFSPAEMLSSGSVLGRATLPVNLVYACFLLLAAWGGRQAWSRDPASTAVILGLIGWYVIIALVLYGGSRIALGIVPGVIIFAAIGLETLLDNASRGPAQDSLI